MTDATLSTLAEVLTHLMDVSVLAFGIAQAKQYATARLSRHGAEPLIIERTGDTTL